MVKTPAARGTNTPGIGFEQRQVQEENQLPESNTNLVPCLVVDNMPTNQLSIVMFS